MSHRLTILERVQAVMDSGNFVKAPCYLPPDNEDEIGMSLNDYQKAVYTVLIEVISEYDKCVDNLNSEALSKEEEIDESDRLYFLERKILAVSALLRVDIRERILEEKLECDIDRIGVGNRFELVEDISEDEADENPSEESPNDECSGIDVVGIKFNPAFKGIFSGFLLFPISERPEEN